MSLPHLLLAMGLYDGMQNLGVGITDLELLQKGDTAEDALVVDEDGNVDYGAGVGTNVFACDLGSFPAEYDSVINAGNNTLNSTVMLNLTFANPTDKSYRLSSFACYDTLYFISDDGLLNVRK